MFAKLSVRNAKRQLKDYLIYIITITISVSLIYGFNALVFSHEINYLVSVSGSLKAFIVASSILIVFIIGWLINYTMGFMLNKRSKEMGTYILLGIERSDVVKMFFNENLLIGGFALLIGLFVGSFIYQIIRVIIMNLYNMPYHFKLELSIGAMGLTILYFMAVYLISLFRVNKIIRKLKIYDLVYFDKQNEIQILIDTKKRKRIFISSLISVIIGLVLMYIGGSPFVMLGAMFLIYFIYSFFISLSSYVSTYYDNRPNKKYRRNSLFIFRSLTSKINTMSVALATLSLLMALTIIATGTGLVFNKIIEMREGFYTLYDLSVTLDDDSEFEKYKQYIEQNIEIRESYLYSIYSYDDDSITSYLESLGNIMYGDNNYYMSYKDYSYLRNMLGYEPVEMSNNQFIIHCLNYVQKDIQDFVTQNKTTQIEGKILAFDKIYTENFNQYFYMGNGDNFIIIVPDDVALSLNKNYSIFAAMTNSPVMEEQYKAMEYMGNGFVSTKAKVIEQSKSEVLLFVFPLFYLALILTMVVATILAIQLLSDVNVYKQRYKILDNLGLDKREQLKTMRTQMFIYYLLPFLPAVIVSTTIIVFVADSTDKGIFTSLRDLGVVICIAIGVFLMIYLLYILVAYNIFKRNVIE